MSGATDTSSDRTPSSFLWLPLEHPARWVLAVCAVVAAAAHIPVIGEHLHEAPYMGEEFIVLTCACLLLGAAALICDSAAVYSLAILTCSLAVLGYILTRAVAFPDLADDVGNWFEPLGVVSVLTECAIVGTAVFVLVRRRCG